MEPHSFLPGGWQAKLGQSSSPILYAPNAGQNGMHPLWLVEIASFHWELQTSQAWNIDELELQSSLSASLARNQWHQRRSAGRLNGEFRFTIYLGTASFRLLHRGRPIGLRLRFEVITEKIHSSEEYRAMVEAIGSRCSQLLLDWGSPTTVNLTSGPTKPVQNGLVGAISAQRQAPGLARAHKIEQAVADTAQIGPRPTPVGRFLAPGSTLWSRPHRSSVKSVGYTQFFRILARGETPLDKYGLWARKEQKVFLRPALS